LTDLAGFMPNQMPDDCPHGQPDARPAPARSARLLFKAATHAHSTRIRAPGRGAL